MLVQLIPERLAQVHAPGEVQDEPQTNALTELYQYLRDAVVSYSPVTRLPPETLAYIFQISTHNSSRGPFYLAQVSKLWRDVAHSDPHLWTFINVIFPPEDKNRENDVQRVQRKLDLYLNRSGTLPVSLTFTDYRWYHESTRSLVSLLADRLRAHSSRWKRLSFQLSCRYFPLLFTFTPCDLCTLEYLCITGDVARELLTPRLSLDSAPNLKTFSYKGPGHILEESIDVPWERLTDASFDLVFVYPASSRLFTPLAQCQNITTCFLSIGRPTLYGDQNIYLPHLHTLWIRRRSSESHAPLLDALTLPRLQTLGIDRSSLVDWYGLNDLWHEHNFSNLLARSGCALRHLSIGDAEFPNDELIRCLALSPTLTSLRFVPFERLEDIGDVIDALDVSRTPSAVPLWGDDETSVGNGPLVPELHKIVLLGPRGGGWDATMAMFRSRGGACARVAGVAALRRVEVVFETNYQFENAAVWRMELAQWALEVEKERRGGERLEVSAVVLSSSRADLGWYRNNYC